MQDAVDEFINSPLDYAKNIKREIIQNDLEALIEMFRNSKNGYVHDSHFGNPETVTINSKNTKIIFVFSESRTLKDILVKTNLLIESEEHIK